jgi:hypothetical protein
LISIEELISVEKGKIKQVGHSFPLLSKIIAEAIHPKGIYNFLY